MTKFATQNPLQPTGRRGKGCGSHFFEKSLSDPKQPGRFQLPIKPAAKPFRKWVTAEVLPTIRKTGSYSFDTQSQQPATSKEVVAFLQTTTSAFWMVNEVLLQCRVVEGEMRRAKKAMAAIMRSSREVFPVAKEILDDITSNAWQDLPGGKMLEVERHNSGY